MAENASTVNETVQNENVTFESLISAIKMGTKTFNNLTDEERSIMIDVFNNRNEGLAQLIIDKPTEEFTLQCKKDFEDYQNEYFKIPYEIAKKDKALEYAKWLNDWNDNRVFIQNRMWIGNMKFREAILDIIKKIEENADENLTFDYSALTYVYILMMNPVGIGKEYSEWMAENQETYNAILEVVNHHVQLTEIIKKKISMLRIKWGLACQGFVLKWDDSLKDLKDLTLLKDIDISGLE